MKRLCHVPLVLNTLIPTTTMRKLGTATPKMRIIANHRSITSWPVSSSLSSLAVWSSVMQWQPWMAYGTAASGFNKGCESAFVVPPRLAHIRSAAYFSPRFLPSVPTALAWKRQDDGHLLDVLCGSRQVRWMTTDSSSEKNAPGDENGKGDNELPKPEAEDNRTKDETSTLYPASSSPKQEGSSNSSLSTDSDSSSSSSSSQPPINNSIPASTESGNSSDNVYNNPYLFFAPSNNTDSSKSMAASWWRRFLSHKTGAQKRLRRIAGDVLISIGFGASSASSLLSSNSQDFQKVQENVRAMMEFLQTSEIEEEIRQVLSSTPDQLLDQIVLLGRAQDFLVRQENNGDPRDALLSESSSSTSSSLSSSSSTEVPQHLVDGLRLVKFAVAAYGDAVIQAAQMDLTGQIRDPRIVLFGSADDEAQLSRSRISEHISVPASDIVVLDVAYSASSKQLRHFVAVDHAHRQVVLSIRGTFSLAELVSDVVAFSRKLYSLVHYDERLCYRQH